MAAILHFVPASVSTLQPVTPVALEHVVKTCLEKNPDDRWQTFALSPDETRIILSRSNNSSFANVDLWMRDLDRGTDSRFTFQAGINAFAVWSPDGSSIAFLPAAHAIGDKPRRRCDGTARLYAVRRGAAYHGV